MTSQALEVPPLAQHASQKHPLEESSQSPHKKTKNINENECKNHRRSLFVCKNIKCGDTFTEQNIKSVRPANGLHTKHYDNILGKISKKK